MFKHLDKFLEFISAEKRYSKHTMDAYRRDVNQMVDFMNVQYEVGNLSAVTLEFLRSWQIELYENGLKPRTIRRKISAVKTFFNYLIREDILSINPANGLNLPKLEKRLPTFVPKKYMSELLALENYSQDFSGIRDCLVINLLYATGIRRAELINLDLNNINTERKVISISGKGNKQRLVPIGPVLLTLISTYSEFRAEVVQNGTDKLILTDKGKPCYPRFVYNLVTKYLSTVPGINKRSPHVMRHSFATHLADEGADLNAIKTMMGHSNLSATEIYTHNSIESLQKVYKQAFPKSGNNS